MRRALLMCLAGALLVATISPASARPRRQRRPMALTLAAQPFLLARATVHAVAAPIIFNAPRAAFLVASAPIRVAYRSANRASVYRGELADEAELNEDDAAPEAEPEAYFTNRTRHTHPPREERGRGSDEADNDESNGPRQAAGEAEGELRGGARPTVAGNRAVLRGGIAYAPANAPQRVKDAIWATNSLRRKPYVWGGGHGTFQDRGYDCSGTVSFALHHAGALGAPLPSSDLSRFGERGRGRWFTIYARSGHTFAVIAGLRLDTTDFNNGGNVGPRWHVEARDTFGYVARHPAGM